MCFLVGNIIYNLVLKTFLPQKKFYRKLNFSLSIMSRLLEGRDPEVVFIWLPVLRRPRRKMVSFHIKFDFSSCICFSSHANSDLYMDKALKSVMHYVISKGELIECKEDSR